MQNTGTKGPPMPKTYKGCPPGKGWKAYRLNKNTHNPDGIRPVSRAASNASIQEAIDEALNPTSAPGKVRSLAGGDFSPEEIRELEKLYGRKK